MVQEGVLTSLALFRPIYKVAQKFGTFYTPYNFTKY